MTGNFAKVVLPFAVHARRNNIEKELHLFSTCRAAVLYAKYM